jgi:RNA polymerase sigma-70 factor, ECF subfamily
MELYQHLSATELAKACAGSKDERTWTEFIRRFQVVIAAAVMRTALQHCDPPRALVDDLIQDTYLKLCENDYRLLRTFRALREDSIYGFLKVVAANVVHDHFKSANAAKRGAGLTEAFSPAHPEPSTSGPDGFELLHHRLRLKQVDKVLAQFIPGKDQARNRTVFWLRHQQGLTASEIAAIPSIGLTTEGVESLLMRQSIAIRGHLLGQTLLREVKVLRRKNRSNRLGP